MCLSLCADVCNSTDLPELEIISLLEEQLPVYKLRADTIFGYEQDDWLHTPLVVPDAALDLTTEQIEETLKYFCEFHTWNWSSAFWDWFPGFYTFFWPLFPFPQTNFFIVVHLFPAFQWDICWGREGFALTLSCLRSGRDRDRNIAICPPEYGRDSWLRLPQQTYLMALSLASPQLHVVFLPPLHSVPCSARVCSCLIKPRAVRQFLFMPAVKKNTHTVNTHSPA